MEQESEWKQLGSLASSVLRMAAEKRMKQTEFMAVENERGKAPKPSTQSDERVQLPLPFFQPTQPMFHVIAGRH